MPDIKRPPTESQLDDLATAAIPVLSFLGDLSFTKAAAVIICAQPNCRQEAAGKLWAQLFTEDGAEVETIEYPVCRGHRLAIIDGWKRQTIRTLREREILNIVDAPRNSGDQTAKQ